MKRVSHIIIAFVALFGASKVMAQSVAPENRVPLADPYILLHEGTYYAYGTHHRDGIECYISNDLKSWYNGGLVLHKNDSYGKKWFWAPEVYHINGKFYMYGGTLKDGVAQNGGNVYVNGGCTFEMYGGSLVNGTAVKDGSDTSTGMGGNFFMNYTSASGGSTVMLKTDLAKRTSTVTAQGGMIKEPSCATSTV